MMQHLQAWRALHSGAPRRLVEWRNYAREPAATQFVLAGVAELCRYLLRNGELEDQNPCLTMSWRGTPLTQAREVAAFLTSWALAVEMLFGTSQLMALHSQ